MRAKPKNALRTQSTMHSTFQFRRRLLQTHRKTKRITRRNAATDSFTDVLFYIDDGLHALKRSGSATTGKALFSNLVSVDVVRDVERERIERIEHPECGDSEQFLNFTKVFRVPSRYVAVAVGLFRMGLSGRYTDTRASARSMPFGVRLYVRERPSPL